MSKYRFLSLIWLIPGWLAFLVTQQFLVYSGSKDTFETGDAYASEVIEMDVKQIAAQSNGYIIIRFTTNSGEVIERRKTLSIQMAQQLLDASIVPIYYKEGNLPDIVMLPTYEIQRKTSFFNGSVAFLGFLVMVAASLVVQRYSNARSKISDDPVLVERVDS